MRKTWGSREAERRAWRRPWVSTLEMAEEVVRTRFSCDLEMMNCWRLLK